MRTMRCGGAQHTYLVLGGIVGAIVLVLAETKTFLAAQRYIDELAVMPPIAARDQPPTSRPLSRTRATGAAPSESGRQSVSRPTRHTSQR